MKLTTKTPGQSYVCACSQHGCLFYLLRIKFIDTGSEEEIKNSTTILITNIQLACSQKKMSECILGALRECIEAWKRMKLPIESPFYSVQFNGKSLPTLIILYSPSEIQSKVETRYSLFCMILEEIPPSKATRDEMCLACAYRGLNSFFRLIVDAGVGETQPCIDVGCRWQVHSAAYGEIDKPLGYFNPKKRYFEVRGLSNGLGVYWGILGGLLQKFRSAQHIGRQFVTRGLIWGLYLSTSGDRWEIRLCVLKPSQIERTIYVHGDLLISRSFLAPGHSNVRLHSLKLSTGDFLIDGTMPPLDTCWRFSKDDSNRCYAQVSRNGGCFMMLLFRIEKK